jgi:hypothetical protein
MAKSCKISLEAPSFVCLPICSHVTPQESLNDLSLNLTMGGLAKTYKQIPSLSHIKQQQWVA